MAQYIYLQQDDSLGDNVRIINATPQQVMTATGDNSQRNVYVYHQPTATQSPQSSHIQASHFQHQQQQPPAHQQQQWIQTGIQPGQVIYSSPPQVQQQQQQQTVVSQPQMNVIVQPANMNTGSRPLNSTTYMKMVTVNSPQHLLHQQQQIQQQPPTMMLPRAPSVVSTSAGRQQMVPVILNTAYRPQGTSTPQSVIIQNHNPPSQRPTNVHQNSTGVAQPQQHTQQVIIDPRSFMQVHATAQSPIQTQQQDLQAHPQGGIAATSRSTVQFRLVQAKPQVAGAPNASHNVSSPSLPGVRFTRPQQQLQPPRTVLLNNRMGNPRIVRPQVRMMRTPGGGLQAVRVGRPGAPQQQPRSVRPANVATTTSRLQQSKLPPPPMQKITTYNPVIRKPAPMVAVPRPPPSWAPVVEVRQPHLAGGDSKSDDDIENSLSTAILHRQPQDSNAVNSPGPSRPQQPQVPPQTHRGPPGSVDISSVMHTDVINTQNSCDTARMLVVLPDEERRLITFTLPSESCTVTELLEQVGIDLTPSMQVRCVAIADEGLDYVVTITEEKPAPPLPPPQPQQSAQVVQINMQLQTPQQPLYHSHPQPPALAVAQQPLQVTQSHQRKQVLPPAPVVPELVPKHVPKHVEGFLAICDFCGFLSMDHGKCERCQRVLTTPQKKPTKPPPAIVAEALAHGQTAKAPTKVATPNLRMATPLAGGKAKRTATAVRTQSVRGRGVGGTPSSAARGRGARARKVEEPVVLTLSSDDEEAETEEARAAVTTHSRYAFEPVYADDGGAGDSADSTVTDVPDADRVDVCGQIGEPGSVNTTIECKELRFGSYLVPVPSHTLVSITHLGIKFVVPHVQDKSKLIKLQVQSREIMKFIVHYEKNLPVIFLYTTPGCGRYIRRALGMGPVLALQRGTEPAPAYYDPTNCQEQVKRIVMVAKVLRDDSKQTIKLVFPRQMYDEITYRDALDLLQKSRGAVEAEGGPSAPRRSSAIAAMATIKKYAAAEIGVPVKGDASSQPTQPGEGLDIHKLMIYPPQGKGGISINTEDYQCLAVDQYLNDVIIDFYLKYLHQEMMSPGQRERTHIFSSFFYKRLTATSARQRHLERELKMTAAQKRHNRVKSWTKNVDLFDKDFVVIPINELSHWFLAIICFPGMDRSQSARPSQEGPGRAASKVSAKGPQLTKQAVKDMEKRRSGLMSVTIGNTTITPVGKREENIYVNEETLSERDEAEGDESDMMTEDEDEEDEGTTAATAAATATRTPSLSQDQLREPIKQPCILVFDSLRGTVRSRVTATLREYLTCEYAARKAAEAPEKIFDKHAMPGHNAKVPQQNNFTDCGLFVLQYVEEMIRNPISDFKLPMKALKSWFNTHKVTRKREDIAFLIRRLLGKQHADRVHLLPEIDFPTVNGEPVEPEKPQPALLLTPPQKPDAVRSEEGDEGADSEDLFDEIANTVVDEQEAAMEEESNVSLNSEKKVTKLMIPSLSKRKSTVDPNGASPGSSENSSLRKAARIS